MRTNSRVIRIGGVMAAMLLAGTAMAQPRVNRERPNDGVGVARISAANGDVSKRHGDNGDVVSADAGAPLVSGDSVRTGSGARAEVRLDDSNFLRLGPGAEVQLRQLGDHYFRIEVVRGEVGYTMLKYGRAETSLHAPNADFVLVKEGVYRVAVDGPNSSRVIVRKGEAEVLTSQRSVVVHSGRSMRVEELDHGTRAAVVGAPNKDGFDEWAARRDQMLGSGRPGYGGWYPRTMIGVGYGYGYPFYDPFWGFYGGYYPRYYGGGGAVIVRGGRRR